MGKLTLLLLILLGWLQYSLWLGKNGIHDYVRVKDDVVVQQGNNAKLKDRNEQLFAEIDDLNGTFLRACFQRRNVAFSSLQGAWFAYQLVNCCH